MFVVIGGGVIQLGVFQRGGGRYWLSASAANVCKPDPQSAGNILATCVCAWGHGTCSLLRAVQRRRIRGHIHDCSR